MGSIEWGGDRRDMRKVGSLVSTNQISAISPHALPLKHERLPRTGILANQMRAFPSHTMPPKFDRSCGMARMPANQVKAVFAYALPPKFANV